MSDATCDPQDAVPAYRRSGFWVGTLCCVALVPVVLPPRTLTGGDEASAIVSVITLFTLLLLLLAFWPAAFGRSSGAARLAWKRGGIESSTLSSAAGLFGIQVYHNFCLVPARGLWGPLVNASEAATFYLIVCIILDYGTNRLRTGWFKTARPVLPTRRVPAWPVWLERGVVLVAPYALAVAATVLTAAGWLPRAPSPSLGWSCVAVVALAWTLPSLAAWLVAQIVILPLVPVSVQAQRCGFGIRHRSTEQYLLHYGLPWAGCLGLVTAEIMSGRPFWSLSPAMWLWAIPGVLAGSSGAYLCAASPAQSDRG